MESVLDGTRGPSGLLPLAREVPNPEDRDSTWVVDLATGRIVRRENGGRAEPELPQPTGPTG